MTGSFVGVCKGCWRVVYVLMSRAGRRERGGRERERERGGGREGEEDGMLVPARVVCVVANTVPKHDLLHMWQKVSVIV